MYSFEPTEEQRMLIEAVERYAANDLRPAAHDADETGELPPELIEKGWEMGVLQASVPESYGGFGDRSAVTGVLAAEAMAHGDLAGTLAVFTPSAYALPLLIGGTEEQKGSLIPPVIEAEWRAYVAAFIEPDFNFNPLDMKANANRSNGGYVLTGEKAYVPYAERAESILVFASEEGKTQAYLVPKGSEGVEIKERERLLGLGGLRVRELL